MTDQYDDMLSAVEELLGNWSRSAAIIRMSLCAIASTRGRLPGDPALLIPRDRPAFMALAKRTGIDRPLAAYLARTWRVAR